MSREIQRETLSIEESLESSSRRLVRKSTYADEYKTTTRLLAGNRFSVAGPVRADTLASILTDASNEDGGSQSGPGIFGAIFNLGNTILGAALTGLPYVVSASGVIPFLVFISISAYIGYSSICFLILACAYIHGGRKDFQVVGETALGPNGLKITAIVTCLSCYGALISYMVLIGIQAPLLCKLAGFDTEPWMTQIALAICLIFPLCMLKDISGLSPTSFLAMIVFGLMAATGIVFLLSNDGDFYRSEKNQKELDFKPGRPGIEWFPREFGLFQISQFPTIIMAFNCQYAFLPIVASLRNCQEEDMRKVGKGGVLGAYAVYVCLGICAYLTYQGNTEKMILLNFRHCYGEKCKCATEPCPTDIEKCPKMDREMQCLDENVFITILNGLFLFAVLMGYPCVHFALRKAQIALTVGMDANFSWKVHGGFATLNVILTLIIALIVGSDVSKVFRWTGAVASPVISYILPSFFYFKILQNNEVPFASQHYKCIAIIIYGLCVICLGVMCNILVP